MILKKNFPINYLIEESSSSFYSLNRMENVVIVFRLKNWTNFTSRPPISVHSNLLFLITVCKKIACSLSNRSDSIEMNSKNDQKFWVIEQIFFHANFVYGKLITNRTKFGEKNEIASQIWNEKTWIKIKRIKCGFLQKIRKKIFNLLHYQKRKEKQKSSMAIEPNEKLRTDVDWLINKQAEQLTKSKLLLWWIGWSILARIQVTPAQRATVQWQWQQ